MQVSKLMTRATVFHTCSALSLVGLLVDDKTVDGNNCPDLILFLLTTDAEDLVVNLDRGKVLR